MTTPLEREESDNSRLFRRTLIVMAAIGLAVATWQLAQLLLVLFASVLVGVMLHDFAVMLRDRMKLPFALALSLAVLIPLASLVVIFWLFGSLMYEQFAQLATQFPEAVREVQAWLRARSFGREVLSQINSYAPEMNSVLGFAQTALANVGSALSGLAVVLVAGVYVAAQPGLYVDGVLDMMPAERAARARDAIHTVKDSLTAWLKGQAIGMVFVAVGTTVGLLLVGVPSALAIGLVAGLCEFVPYLGVVVVTIPTIILGFGQDAQTGWLTIVALIVVQQVQGNVVMPIAQRRFGDLPPVLTIFSLIGAGVLLGPLGVVLAVPMTVVGLALLKARLARKGKHSALTEAAAA